MELGIIKAMLAAKRGKHFSALHFSV
jgi:hypothetical protein